MTNIDDYLAEQKIITISRVIDEEVLEDFHKKIIYMNGIEGKSPKERLIRVYINSYGGDLSSSFAICDMIYASVDPVYTYCIGEAMSGGFMILVAGEKRFVSERATLMVHNFSMLHEGNYDELVAKRELEDYLDKITIEHFLRHSKFKTEKQVKEKLLQPVNTHLSPENALKYGLVDYILRKEK